MSGREAGHQPAADPDALEVVPGKERENLEGWVPETASAEELRKALEQAFDYRGDVLITRKNGSTVEGYVFDRRSGRTLQDSVVRVLPKNGSGKLSVPYDDIAALAFTGRDMAAGKSWETWVRQYWEKRQAGEHISLHPEELE
ncbi:MAG TPA: hypothetical protein VFU27_16780 [Terriglobales bacterium]|nr:hypothetical protein [Terriglobales bacterium]